MARFSSFFLGYKKSFVQKGCCTKRGSTSRPKEHTSFTFRHTPSHRNVSPKEPSYSNTCCHLSPKRYQLTTTMRATLCRRMNRLLVDPAVDRMVWPSVELAAQDPRVQHVRHVLKLKDGDSLRSGVVNQGLDDHSSITWLQDLRLRITFNDASIRHRQAPRPRLSLILALPPPRVLARVLPLIGTVGVDRLHLTNAAKVDKGYFSSHFLYKESKEATKDLSQGMNGRLRGALRTGLEQAGAATAMPLVTTHRSLHRLLEEVGSGGGDDGSGTQRLFAHPATASPRRQPRAASKPEETKDVGEPRGRFTLDSVPFFLPSTAANSSVGGGGGTGTAVDPPRVLLAVGPDGGWDDPDELELLHAHGFGQVSLAGGVGVLKTEHALAALCTRAHERIEREMAR
jgi:16S rRNA U1498 N3-methylase RsmE